MKIIIKRVKEITLFFFIIVIFIIIFTNSSSVKTAAKEGMLLCSDVIIPVLFPFLVLSLIISKCGIFEAIPFPAKYRFYLTYINIFLLSNLGGYPIGAKLLSGAVESGKISENDARLMLFCCINAGPAFTVLAVGGGILDSLQLGALIYISQFLASLTIFIIISNKLEKRRKIPKNNESLIDAFVSSVADASISMLNMSGFIIISSIALGLFKSLNLSEPVKKVIFLTLEISNSILHTKNIYVLCFVLGFSSISIILQIIFFTKSFKPNNFSIIVSRIIVGLLSTIYTLMLIKIFHISIETVGNITSKIIINNNNSLILSLLLILTCIAFLYSLSNKKYCGKFSADIF